MASVKIFPRLDKANKQGKVPMYLRLTKNRKSKYIALDVYIDPKHWNAQTGKVKPGAKNASQINSFLAAKGAEAEALALEMETKSKFITAYDIKSKIIGKAPAEFFGFVEMHRKNLLENLKISTIRQTDGAIEKFKKFCKNEQLFFDEINVKFIQDYQEYLKDKLNNQANTIHSNLKIIRKIILYAVGEEMIPMERNPFNKVKLRGEKTRREFLLDDELERLENLELVESTMINHHRNLYIFSAYSGGIRISDLLLMRWRNFDGQHLYFQIKKTKEDLSIKLPKKALSILLFYRSLAQKKFGDQNVLPEYFIFPLLKIRPNETDELRIFRAISSATAYTNKNLRELTKRAKIDKQISFHSARHSWAVRALQKGMRIEYVSKLMGHASVKQTEVYAKILNMELDKAMSIFDKKERKIRA
ncbi:site-specific integrase [Mucilaginibacter sp. SG564]|uniref:site-specific integrase n=1 Tax=Mucilaginibacter sp. SG564 TaxID=2587022 RepID=UPI00210FFCE4|nr:site-specific integrase [Mucilaginibacter sp. SG564]NOW97206.1 integrase [Mucilaginibacter sp. SG564]